MDALNVVGTVSAAVAALAALGALYVAWKTLHEGRDTIAELKKLRAAAQQEAEAARETTRALHFILNEARLERELEALRAIARQVAAVIEAMRLVRDEESKAHWHQFTGEQRLLAAQVAGVGVDLPRCKALAEPQADPRFETNLQEQAPPEIRAAIMRAREQLAEVIKAYAASQAAAAEAAAVSAANRP